MKVGDKLRHIAEETDHWDVTITEIYPTCLVFKEKDGEMGAMVIPDQTQWYRVVEEPLPGPFTGYVTKVGMELLKEGGAAILNRESQGAKYEVEVTVKRRL